MHEYPQVSARGSTIHSLEKQNNSCKLLVTIEICGKYTEVDMFQPPQQHLCHSTNLTRKHTATDVSFVKRYKNMAQNTAK